MKYNTSLGGLQLCRAPCVPQGKLGGCTVISRGVILNYTTYYLNLGASRPLRGGVGGSFLSRLTQTIIYFTELCAANKTAVSFSISGVISVFKKHLKSIKCLL